ncbi:type II secretion system F family protein [Paenibacillus protaetiae]|uniref:Type II secretion protein F n=1 Tax=Paenibacillus protaetiae TaxID=2509456 RepID=A0A4P6EY98_9BACL|nr:type II secretion system F family protein [Paenibacillus protaetiae]QAY66749.1 type II secretion protein F [Paenibacillus protaetiae]
MIVFPLLLTVLWLVLCGRRALQAAIRQLNSAARNKAAGRSGSRHAFKELLLVQPFHEAMERWALYDRFQLQLGSCHTKLLVLKGRSWTLERTKLQVAEAVAYAYAAVTACTFLSVITSELLLILIGFIAGLLLAVRPFMEAGRLVERRKQEILLELPETISKLLLLVSAGETTLRAMARCLDGKDAEQHPLYREWRTVVLALQNGDSFSTAIERFNRSCAVQEVSVFTTVLLLNYRRGGEHFTLALRELSYGLWEKRKAVARSRGEEASSKLVFPLVGILLSLMVLVAAPAVMMM